MADEGGILALAVAAFLDILVGEAGKRRPWVRAVTALGTLLFLGLIGGAIYVTLRYS